MRQTRKLAFGLLAVALVTACTDNGVFNPLNDASGNYTLTVYQGRTIPATFPNFIVTSGTLALNSNGNFTETNNFQDRSTGQVTQFVSQGTWNLNGDQLSLFAPPQNGDNQRNISGTLDFDANNNATVTYSELDNNGVLQSYEYKR